MAIKLCDRFTLKRDRYQWILEEYSGAISEKTGEPVKPYRTYYPRLRWVVNALLDRESQHATTINELVGAYELAGDKMEHLLTEVVKNNKEVICQSLENAASETLNPVT